MSIPNPRSAQPSPSVTFGACSTVDGIPMDSMYDITLYDQNGEVRQAALCHPGAEIDTQMYKLDSGELLFLQKDGTLQDWPGKKRFSR